MKNLAIFLSFAAISFPTFGSGSESPEDLLSKLLNQQISGSTKYTQQLGESPNQTLIANASDIDKFGFRTLSEILQSVNGLTTSNQRDYSYVNIRGFSRPGDYNTRLLVLNDGARVNDPIYDSGLIGHEAPIDVDWIKRFEYISGSGSSLYGSNALFGIVNTITLSGKDINGTKIKTSTQSDNRNKFSLISGTDLGYGNDVAFGISGSDGKGPNLYYSYMKDQAYGNHGWANRLDSEKFIKSYFKINAFEWQFNGGISLRNKNIPNGYYGTSISSGGTYNTDNYYHLTATRLNEINQNTSQTIKLRYVKYDYQGNFNYGNNTSHDIGQSESAGIDYLIDHIGIDKHRIISGIELQKNFKLYQASPTVGFSDKRQSNKYGVYTQDQWNFANNWIQYLGIRYDKINEKDAISPKWSLINNLNERSVLRLSTSRAFRPANYYERFYHIDGSQASNPSLKNEYLTNFETSIDHAVSVSWVMGMTLYHYKLNNMIQQIKNESNLLQFINHGNLIGNGIEISSKNYYENLRAQTGIAIQNTNNSNQSQSTNTPRLLGQLLIDADLPKENLTISLHVQSSSSIYNSSNQNINGYTYSNLFISQKKSSYLGKFSFGIYNLFNKKYLAPAQAAIPSQTVTQDGRVSRLLWELNF